MRLMILNCTSPKAVRTCPSHRKFITICVFQMKSKFLMNTNNSNDLKGWPEEVFLRDPKVDHIANIKERSIH